MINYYISKNNSLEITEYNDVYTPDFSFNDKWTSLINPTDKEIEYVANKTGIPEDTLKAALDEEERAHIDFDEGTLLVLVDVPIIEEENDYYTYTTIPFGIILKDNAFITISLKSNAVIRDFTAGRVKNFSTGKRTRFLFQILYNNSTKYLQYLRQIDKSSQRIQTELHKSMKNKELIQLLDLENSLVYFSTSLRANDMVIERLVKFENLKKYEEDVDLLEDVAVENKQALEMCNIYRDILNGTMEFFASIISNNLNIVMKLLTGITIIIAIPTLVASLLGMNVGGLPFQGKFGFYIITGIALVLALIGAFILNKKKMM